MARKRKAPKQQEEVIPDIFEALGKSTPDQDGQGQQQQAQPAAAAKGPSMDDLLKQIADLNARVETAERTNVALTTAPPALPAEIKEPTFSLDGLPDPLDDKDGYARELASRQQKYAADLQAFYGKQTDKAAAQDKRANDLWKDFTSEYSDYADNEDGLSFATNKVIAQAKKKGLDVERYMYQHSDRFFKDIVKTYDDIFGAPDGEDDPAPSPRRRAAPHREADDGDDGRSESVLGGLEGSGSNTRTPAGPKPGDMIKDLQDLQRKSGYY